MHALITRIARLHISIERLEPGDEDAIEIMEQEIASIEVEAELDCEISAGQRDMIYNNLETARAMLGACVPQVSRVVR